MDQLYSVPDRTPMMSSFRLITYELHIFIITIMKNKHQWYLLMCCKEDEMLPVQFRHVHSELEAVQEDV